MRRFPALLVSLLLVVTVVPAAGLHSPPVQSASAAAAPPVPSITPINGTTNQLSIPDNSLRTAEFETTGIDVGTAVARGSRETRLDHEMASFEFEFRRTTSEFERTQLIRAHLDTIEDRQAMLATRQQQAIEQYGSGTMSVETFVQTRALVDDETRKLLAMLAQIERIDRNTPDYSMASGIQTRVQNAKGNLRMLQGPVGTHLSESLAGEVDGTPVYIETGSGSYMLAMIQDGQYLTETYLGDQREETAPDQFAQSNQDLLRAAADRAEVLYPWLYDRQLPSVQTYGTTQIYQIRAEHSRGQLTAYIDGGTTDVFREIQSRQLSAVTTTETRTTVTDSVRVDVSRTYETGPLRVSVAENETEIPVRGTVSINDRQLGTTGGDGVIWLVEPRGSYTVSVNTSDGDRLVVTVPDREQ